MKRKIIALSFTLALVTGCGSMQEESDYFDELTSRETIVEETKYEKETETTVSSAETEVNDVEESSEEQPYVLDFDGKTVDGADISADILKNSKLTMINVWGTFCGPCLNEMPDLGAISKEYAKEDFQMIGIVADVAEGSETSAINEVKEIISMTGADYPHILLNEELHVNLVAASDSVPTTYFFNNKAELLGYVVGARSKDDWKGLIDEVLLTVQ